MNVVGEVCGVPIWLSSDVAARYGLAVGDVVAAGQVIGTESNVGYTLDSYGNVCGYSRRDCGYHTHLNVFDKRVGANIDPLTLIPASYP